MKQLRVTLVQQDFHVGDIAGNLHRIKAAIDEAIPLKPDLLVFPELAITGYPPEDLLYRGGFLSAAEDALSEIATFDVDFDLIVGHPLREADKLFNAVSYLRQGRTLGQYRKQALPNYAVFDEKRYFEAGHRPLTIECKGVGVGLLICEDIWETEPAQKAARHGCDLIVVPNASPYHLEKRQRREVALKRRAKQTGKPIIYGNLIGGQDELVFDGRSFAVQANGDIVGPTPLYSDGLFSIDFDGERLQADGWHTASAENRLDAIYQTLVRGTRDYVHKCGFSSVLLGLSGGIDSGLVAAVAADALGPSNVHAVMMPSQYTSQLSLELAREQAETLGLRYDSISIESSFAALLDSLQGAFMGKPADLAEENLQARIRGNILMALSNKHGALVMATSNKSETAVGYATIYGDMCGAYSPIKDCVKTLVFELAEYRNSLSPAIPQGVIDRPPSAELRPDQKDSDSLPPYDILDEIVARYVEQDQSIDEIVAAGFEQATVRRVAKLVLINEYKRRQSAPGCRITPRGFGRDRRYPIVNRWRDGT